jgi:hypothetical protein
MTPKHCGLPMQRTEEDFRNRLIVHWRCGGCNHHERELRSQSGILLRWQNLSAKEAAA